MSALRAVYEYAREHIEHPYEVAAVSYGLLLGEVLGRTALPEMVVHANDPFGEQMKMSLPSALPTPEVSGYASVDTAIQIGLAAGSLEFARHTTSRRGLLATALGAQAVACLADAGVERSGLMSQTERAQEDVGFSSVSTAWFTKFLFDKRSQAETAAERRQYTRYIWQFAGALAVISMVDGKTRKLDIPAHASAFVMGYAAHKIGRYRSTRQRAAAVEA